METWKGGRNIGKQIKDEILIAHLISCRTIKEAAEKAGVGETTLHARLKNPEFVRKYRAACLDLLNDHAAEMHKNMGAAVDVQREIMDDRDNPPQIRLNAANEILRIGLAITDKVNILSMLQELEREED